MAASFSMTRITAFLGRVNSSFWFVPAVMAVAAVVLSFVLIEIDARHDLRVVVLCHAALPLRL